VSGLWQAPLRLKISLSGAGLDAEAQGTAEPWAAQPKASVSLKARTINLAPLFDLKPSDRLMQNISVTSRVSLLGSKLTFEDLDGAIAGSRLRGRVALTLDDEHNVEGEVGLDALDLAPAFALAIGAQGRDAAEPLGSGLLKGWRGRIAFQALRGQLPGGGELRPVSGSVRSDGQSLTFDASRAESAAARRPPRSTPDRPLVALRSMRASAQRVDGTALHYRALKMPAGKTSMQMTLASQGRSASALTGAMSGKRNRDAGIRRASAVSIRAPSMSRSAPATPGRRPTISGCARSWSRCWRTARCWSPRRKFRSRSGTAGFASAPPRSIPTSPAPSFPAVTIFRRTRPIFVQPLPWRRSDSRPAVRKSGYSRPARPMRSIAPSTSRRCRHGWR
jgi:hypothetical protein